MGGSPSRVIILLALAGAVLAACGGSSHPAGTGTEAGAPAEPVTHANPVSLLPATSQVRTVVNPVSTPSRNDETLTPSTLSSAFVSQVPQATRLAAGTAELDATGRGGTFLYVHVFEFRSVAGAQALTSTFLGSTRLSAAAPRPSGAPGQEGMLSSQPYGTRQISFRYAFRDDNVLAYVELDGPRGKHSGSQAVQVAATVAQRIHTATG